MMVTDDIGFRNIIISPRKHKRKVHIEDEWMSKTLCGIDTTDINGLEAVTAQCDCKTCLRVYEVTWDNGGKVRE